MWHLDVVVVVVDVVMVVDVVIVDVVVVVGLLVQRHFFLSLALELSSAGRAALAELSSTREREKNNFWHGNLVSSVVVVVVVVVGNLAATHVSTSSAGTHEAGMGDSRSPFSDAQTN